MDELAVDNEALVGEVVIDPAGITKKELKAKVPEGKALINLSQDPAGLRVFMDQSKKGRLKYSVDIVKCIDLHLKGVSYKDIALTQGLNGDNPKVQRWLSLYIKKYKPDINTTELDVFQGFRTAYLRKKQKQMLDAITEEKIEAASLKDLAFAHDKFFANERLNENKSTGNIAHQFSSLVEEIHQQRSDGTDPSELITDD